MFETKEDVRELFLELWNYWSFFDYEFLSIIIDRFCSDLKSELQAYISSFKEYCERRICEIPSDVFKKREDDDYNLYVKCDHNFDKDTVKNVKDLECHLSDLLDTELYLLGVEEGCLKLQFSCFCSISTPLNPKTLKELKILRLYKDENNVYFDATSASSTFTEGHPTQSNGPVQTPSAIDAIPNYEITAIADAIEESKKLEELAEALQVSQLLGDANGDARSLLVLWQKETESSSTSSRTCLLYHLARLGMQDLHKK